MAVAHTSQQLVWEGRIHLEDETGALNDARTGIRSIELPLTVHRIDPDDDRDDPITFGLDFEHVQIFGDYPGHCVSLFIHGNAPILESQSTNRLLNQLTVTPADGEHKEFSFRLGTSPGPFYLSLRLRSDTPVNPGFNNDFIFRRLTEISPTSIFFTALGLRD
jgi:hypothetical protein